MNQTIIGFIRKELKQALRDVRMRILMFGIPMLQMTVFGFALSSEVKNIKFKVVHKPGDVIAQRIEKRAYASNWFVPAKTKGNDPISWLKSASADAVLIVDRDKLSSQIADSSAKIQLLIDSTNAVKARQVEGYVRSVVDKVISEHSERKEAPFKFDTRILYNPTMESAIFLVPSVMCLILGVITVILTSMSISKEKESGTFEMLISTPVSNMEIIAGKMLPYILVGLLDLPLVFIVAKVLFGVPMYGHYWQLFLSALVFVCTTVGIGTLISTFSKNQQQAMMGGFMFLYPSILLSGIMFPIENIPAGFAAVAYLDPFMYFVKLFRNIMLKGGNMEVFLLNMLYLFIIGSVVITLAVSRFKQRLN
jgi:drug efflux transport system permease protein